MYSNQKVGWLRAADQTVLALQDRVVTHNARISVSHENYVTWRLRIKQLRETDKACYMCQINSSPMKKQIGCIDVQSEYRDFFFFSLINSISFINLSFWPNGRFLDSLKKNHCVDDRIFLFFSLNLFRSIY